MRTFKKKVRRPKSWLTRRTLINGVAVAGLGAIGFQLTKSLRAEAPRLSLEGYKMTFSEEFNDPAFSIEHFMRRWYPHTPWWGDFGDAVFADPVPGFPFTVDHGYMRIEARKGDDGKWRSGLISSINRQNQGFAQQYGYFEMRAKLPPGPGVWPAFWLHSIVSDDVTEPSIEIDVLEYYGKFPTDIHSTVIIRPKDGTESNAKANIHHVPKNSLTEAFHTYGVSVEADWVIMYLDGVETWRNPTPVEHKHKLMVLANLALGSGWPIEDTINPSHMYIDYIRVYARESV